MFARSEILGFNFANIVALQNVRIKIRITAYSRIESIHVADVVFRAVGRVLEVAVNHRT